MEYNCQWTEIILAILVIIFALWPGLIGAVYSKWIVVIAAVVLVIHALGCKSYKVQYNEKITSKPVKKRRK